MKGCRASLSFHISGEEKLIGLLEKRDLKTSKKGLFIFLCCRWCWEVDWY